MEIEKAEETLNILKKVVAEQALDEGLWFRPQHITEDYLQKALRRLHALVEQDSAILKALEDEDGD